MYSRASLIRRAGGSDPRLALAEAGADLARRRAFDGDDPVLW